MFNRYLHMDVKYKHSAYFNMVPLFVFHLKLSDFCPHVDESSVTFQTTHNFQTKHTVRFAARRTVVLNKRRLPTISSSIFQKRTCPSSTSHDLS